MLMWYSQPNLAVYETFRGTKSDVKKHTTDPSRKLNDPAFINLFHKMLFWHEWESLKSKLYWARSCIKGGGTPGAAVVNIHHGWHQLIQNICMNIWKISTWTVNMSRFWSKHKWKTWFWAACSRKAKVIWKSLHQALGTFALDELLRPQNEERTWWVFVSNLF